MRILHAADLHLGRSFHERDLGPDQAHLLTALASCLVERSVDVLLLAGDIYDKAIPQPEALGLFDAFLKEALASLPGLAILAIPGNHDSPSRLGFASDLLSRAGLHVRARAQECATPIVLAKGGESVSFWCLPYLNPGAFSDGQGSSPASQTGLMEEAMARILPNLDPESPNVLLAHCFASGGAPSESERAFVGAAEEVPLSLFQAFDYVALGHLHRRQALGAQARYPGSPLAYSFAEAQAQAEKGFLLVDLEGKTFTEEFIPIQPLHRVVRLQGSFADLCLPGAHQEHRDDFVEIRLTDSQAVLDPVDALKANFPNLLSLRQAAFEILPPGGEAAERKEASPPSVLEDFLSFHREMKGAEPEPALVALFSDLLKEAGHAPA